MPIVDIDGIGRVELPDDTSLRHKLRYFELAGQLNNAQKFQEQQSSFQLSDIPGALYQGIVAPFGAGAQAGGEQLVQALQSLFPGQTASPPERLGQLGMAGLHALGAPLAFGRAVAAEPMRGHPIFEQRPTVGGRMLASPRDVMGALGESAANVAMIPGVLTKLPPGPLPPLSPVQRAQALIGEQARIRDRLAARLAEIRDARRTTTSEPPPTIAGPQPPAIPHMEARMMADIVPTAEQIGYAKTGGGTPFVPPPPLVGPAGQLLEQTPMRGRTPPSPIVDQFGRPVFRQISPADATAHLAPVESELMTARQLEEFVRPPKTGGGLEIPARPIEAGRPAGMTPLPPTAAGPQTVGPLRIGGFPPPSEAMAAEQAARPAAQHPSIVLTGGKTFETMTPADMADLRAGLAEFPGAEAELGRSGLAPLAEPAAQPSTAEWLKTINTKMFVPGTIEPGIDEVGKINPILATRLGTTALGAVAGGMTGETPEERARHAAFGALGGLATGVVATRAGEAYLAARAVRQPKPPLPIGLTTAISDAVYTATSQRPSAAGGGVPIRPTTALDVLKTIHADASLLNDIEPAMAAQGYTLADLGRLFTEQGVDPRRILMSGTALSKRMLGVVRNDPQSLELLRGVAKLRTPINLGSKAEYEYYAMKASGLVKSALVSAIRTAQRNAIVQQATVGLEAFLDSINGPWRAMFRQTEQADPLMGFRFLMDYFGSAPGTKAWSQMKVFLHDNPAGANRLFLRYSGDVADRGAALGPVFGTNARGQAIPMSPASAAVNSMFQDAELAFHTANTLNWFQEFTTRQMVVHAKMMQRLRHLGVRSMDDIYGTGVSADDLAGAFERSIDDALRVTYADSPKYGPAKWVLDSVAESPTAQIAIGVGAGAWFPRYLWNATRFIYDYPVGAGINVGTSVLRSLWGSALTPGERARILAGSGTDVGKVIAGSIFILAADQLAQSQYAGTKLTTIRLSPGGPEYDVTPFGPFAAYYVAARAMRAYQNKTLGARAQDLADYSFNFGGGPRMEVVDNMIKAAAEYATDPELATSVLEGIAGLQQGQSVWEALDRPSRPLQASAGRFLANFLQPGTSFQNIFGTYGEYVPELEELARTENMKRELGAAPFTAPLQARIPVAIGRTFGIPSAEDLPPKAPPLSGQTPRREEPMTVGGIPLSVEFTGLLGQRLNPAETEAARLGLKPREIQGPGTGEPLADILLRRNLGPTSQIVMTTIVGSPMYQALKDDWKAIVFEHAMRSLRAGAKDLVASRIARNVGAGQPLAPDEVAYLTSHVRGAIEPRVRQMLRHQGVNVPR